MPTRSMANSPLLMSMRASTGINLRSTAVFTSTASPMQQTSQLSQSLRSGMGTALGNRRSEPGLEESLYCDCCGVRTDAKF
ncbi:hypothetical protein KIPB_013125, partial [Kipferlia bialata]|eukprot:g13125.t1